jgi:CBS domain-containing protein
MNRVHDLLIKNRVLDLGPLPAPRLGPEATLQQALLHLVRGRRGAIVAVEGLSPVGILTERDLVYHLSDPEFASAEGRRKAALGDVMSRPPVTVRRQASLLTAIDTMAQRHHRHLVVVSGQGELKGLLNTNDLVQFLTDQFPRDVVNLPPRLHQQYKTIEGA